MKFFKNCATFIFELPLNKGGVVNQESSFSTHYIDNEAMVKIYWAFSITLLSSVDPYTAMPSIFWWWWSNYHFNIIMRLYMVSSQGVVQLGCLNMRFSLVGPTKITAFKSFMSTLMFSCIEKKKFGWFCYQFFWFFCNSLNFYFFFFGSFLNFLYL